MMIVVGDFSGTREIPLRKDHDDHINVIVSIGDYVIEGGMNVYYLGVNMKHVGEKKQSLRFKHGCVQIGYFDNIFHGAEKWDNGNQCVINY